MVLAIGLLVITLYLPTAFISEQYVMPFPLTTCTADCPTNAFMLTGSEPAFLGEVGGLRDVLVVFVFTAAVSILALRIKRATPLIRPMLVPVLATAMSPAGRGGRLPTCGQELSRLGIHRGRRLDRGVRDPGDVDRLPRRVDLLAPGGGEDARAGHGRTAFRPRPRGLESLLAGSEGRGSVRSFTGSRAQWSGSDRWANGVGDVAQLPASGSTQVIAEYESGENKIAVVHEEMLQGQTRFLEAIGSCAIAAQEYERLSTALDSSLQEWRPPAPGSRWLPTQSAGE